MKPFLYLNCLIILILPLINCGDNNSKELIPAPDLNLHITSIPQQNAIRIEWDVNIQEPPVGLIIYRNATGEEDVFLSIGDAPYDRGYYEDADVEVGARYYYCLSALENDSAKTDPVKYTLLDKAILVEPPDQAILEDLSPTFSWLDVSGASDFVVCVHERIPGRDDWMEIWRSHRIYPYQELKVIYSYDNQALKPLERGMNYRWRIDANSGRSAGSKSRWLYFSIK